MIQIVFNMMQFFFGIRIVIMMVMVLVMLVMFKLVVMLVVVIISWGIVEHGLLVISLCH